MLGAGHVDGAARQHLRAVIRTHFAQPGIDSSAGSQGRSPPARSADTGTAGQDWDEVVAVRLGELEDRSHA
jgi:hypothetical protein